MDRDATALEARAAELDGDAAALEASMPGAAEAPAPSEIEMMRAEVSRLEQERLASERADLAAKCEAEAVAARERHRAALEAARLLDSEVKTLTDSLPAALFAEAKGIPGLTLDGPTIRVDGRPLDALSSGEQMRFAVDLAKRLSTSKILMLDGLERIAPAAQEEFLAAACVGGFQVFATRVADGALVLDHLELEAANA